MKIVATIVSALALTGCATSTGIYKVDTETLGVTASRSMGRGGLSAAKETAYEQAGAECAARGQKVETVSEAPRAIVPDNGMAEFGLKFRCQRAG